MKTYEEAIQFACDQVAEGAKDLRYVKWAVYIMLAGIYDKTQEEVYKDMEAELAWRASATAAAKKAERQADQERRRLANLERKQIKSELGYSRVGLWGKV
jgi:response regulator of citrate/malate metabolism